MKKLTTLLAILLVSIAIPSFAQDKIEKPREPIKPALLVIDIQKAFLPMMSSDNIIISHNAEYPKNVEQIFDAITFNVVKLIIENEWK